MSPPSVVDWFRTRITHEARQEGRRADLPRVHELVDEELSGCLLSGFVRITLAGVMDRIVEPLSQVHQNRVAHARNRERPPADSQHVRQHDAVNRKRALENAIGELHLFRPIGQFPVLQRQFYGDPGGSAGHDRGDDGARTENHQHSGGNQDPDESGRAGRLVQADGIGGVDAKHEAHAHASGHKRAAGDASRQTRPRHRTCRRNRTRSSRPCHAPAPFNNAQYCATAPLSPDWSHGDSSSPNSFEPCTSPLAAVTNGAPAPPPRPFARRTGRTGTRLRACGPRDASGPPAPK